MTSTHMLKITVIINIIFILRTQKFRQETMLCPCYIETYLSEIKSTNHANLNDEAEWTWSGSNPDLYNYNYLNLDNR